MIVRPCRTILPAIINKAIGKTKPLLFRKYHHKVALDFYRIGFVGQPKQPREPAHMRVNRNALHNAIRITQYDIGGFSRHPGKFQNFLHRIRPPAAVPSFHRLGSSENIFGFVAVKAGGSDILHEFFWIRTHVIFKRPVFFKQLCGYLIHLLVGALRRQNHRNQKLPIIGILEHDFCTRKEFFQDTINAGGFRFSFLKQRLGHKSSTRINPSLILHFTPWMFPTFHFKQVLSMLTAKFYICLHVFSSSWISRMNCDFGFTHHILWVAFCKPFHYFVTLPLSFSKVIIKADRLNDLVSFYCFFNALSKFLKISSYAISLRSLA